MMSSPARLKCKLDEMTAKDIQNFQLESFERESYVSLFSEILESHYSSQIRQLVVSTEENYGTAEPGSHHWSFGIKAGDLVHTQPALTYLLLNNPRMLGGALDEALDHVQSTVARRLKEEGEMGFAKKHLHIRLSGLPPTSDVCKPSISSIRNMDLDKIISIRGTVVRTGLRKLLEKRREYHCFNKTCEAVFYVECDMSQGNLLLPPKSCPGRTQNGPCKSTRFESLGRQYCDYQELKVQEQVKCLEVGSIPRSITVLLLDDLVGCCSAGDDVEVVGLLLRRWNPVCLDARCTVEVTLLASGLEVNNGAEQVSEAISDDLHEEFSELWRNHSHHPIAARNFIVVCVCPQIFGLFDIKLTILLTLIGGVTEMDSRGVRRRGTCHLLIVGDPGCGKSQFLRFAAKMSPRSVITTGEGSSSAGLTFSVMKDSGEWVLEAGALVLADRGVCCIDEFTDVREDARAAIHEAMEQQTLSVAKAGLVCKLNARTTVFAAANPRGQYDMDEDITVNTAIGSPLLSRFDLILLLLDRKNEEWDRVVSTFVLRSAMLNNKDGRPCGPEGSSSTGAKTKLPQSSNAVNGGGVVGAVAACGALPPTPQKAWPVEKLQKYLVWVRERHPKVTLSSEVEEVLCTYYECQRQNENRSAARTTVRLLESLVRLTQSHARLMDRSTAILQDAIASVMCLEMSVASCSLLGMRNTMHSDFPEDPDGDFHVKERILLDRLGLVGLGEY